MTPDMPTAREKWAIVVDHDIGPSILEDVMGSLYYASEIYSLSEAYT